MSGAAYLYVYNGTDWERWDGVVTASVTGSDGATVDGVDSNIKATVLDYTNSNPLAVRLTDTNGDYVSAGAGTQYTEDVAAAADPIGSMLIARRKDTLSASQVSADGDNIALNSTSKGELNVKHADTIGVTIASAGVASGAFASGSIAAGAIAAGATSIADNEDVASADGDRGVKILAVRKATPANTSSADGDYEFLQISAGRMWASANIDQINGVTPLMGAGNTGTGSPRVTIATDQAALAGLGIYVEDAAETAGGNLSMAGSVRRDTPATSSSASGDNSTVNTNEVGALWGTLTPSANGGCSTFMASGSDGSSILVATAQAVKASAGVLYGYYAYNPEAAVTFVHFYNTAAASVTVGTTNPLFTFAIPAGAAANLALPYGIAFSNAGWSVAATTTAGGNTAPTTGVSLVAWYK